MTYAELTQALLNAREAAKAYIDTEDGGTCNFDSPAIDYKAMHMQKSKVADAIQSAGLRCFEWNCYKYKYLVVCGICAGQGNRRTQMAEAAHNYLKSAGIATTMYYQMD